MSWQVLISGAARKGTRRLPRAHRDALLMFVDALAAEGPVPTGWNARKLTGRKDEFRLRLGGWRIVYRIDRAEQTITLSEIATRGNVY